MRIALLNALKGIAYGAVMGLILGFIFLALMGCDKNQTFKIDQTPDVYNTYVTELYEEYQITNITEQYITEEYIEVTNINGAQIEVVPLCPNLAGNFPEVLLRIDGTLVAYFAQNGNALLARLVVVPENMLLQTTDGRNCRFKIISGEIIYL